MFTKAQLEIINKIESIPCKKPFRPKLSWEEIQEQLKRNNPQGYHPPQEKSPKSKK